jgi:hypothetical protein
MADWRKTATKNYPPLVASFLFLVLLIAVLPSALNLPVTNPTETLEYAPVPPDSDTQPSITGGNLGSLGLGGSSSLIAEVPPPEEQVVSDRPRTKRCAGNPPRQTADPLSPPCVPYFDGNNGGATYQGVTRDEVRFLLYISTNVGRCGHFKGCQDRPVGEYHDLAKPERDDDYYQDVYARNWQRYFNERYQTYGRFVHFFTYYHNGVSTPEARRAAAADNYSVVKPFAVVFDGLSPSNLGAYQEVAHNRGMLVFVNGVGMSSAVFQRFPKLSYGFMPAFEQQAIVYADYLCNKVKPHPTGYGGNGVPDGKERVYGLWYSNDTNNQNFRDFKDLVKTQVKDQCGMTFPVERNYARDGVHQDSQGGAAAVEAVNEFRTKGVTTIVWPMGYETNLGKAMDAAQWFPEIIIAGDGFNDGNWPGADQNKNAWEHAIMITPTLRSKFQGYTQTCEDAYTEVHPDIPRDGFDLTQTCFLYPGLRQMFIGIQVAGPRLGPTSLDKGYRAIPKVESTDPSTPACYYVPGDSTCVKDAEIEWWDSQSDGSNGEISGCWRMAHGGQRFLPGGWPSGNIDADIKPGDLCNGWAAGFGTRLGT